MDKFNESESVAETNEGKQKKGRKTMLRYFAAGLAGALLGSIVMGFVAFNYFNNGKITTSNGTVIYTKDNEPTTVEAIAKTDTPLVVGVTTTQLTQNFFNQTIEQTGVGSGVVVTSDGYIITNEHVVTNNPNSITVSMADGSTFPGKLIWYDSSLDLAVIKIGATGLQTAILGNSDGLTVGELAVAIGNPLGLSFQCTVTAGIVSALNRSIQINNSIYEDLIQTDASINPGNSGGPLINKNGEVIGINSYKISSSEGLGFAIPIDIVKPIINQISKNGEFKENALGVSCVDKEISQYYTSTNNIKLKSGILIVEVQANSGGDKAGLKTNDIITKVDGTEVNTMLKLREIIYSKLPGDTVTVEYTRDGVTNTVNVTLSEASTQ
jgi:serine protease Do